MYLPDFNFETTLVGRHGVSIHNLAWELAEKGDKSLLHAISDIANADVQLADEGRRQATRKGIWLRQNRLDTFDFYATSKFRRAIQTAELMLLPNANWIQDERLNERDWGLMSTISSHEVRKRWPTFVAERARNALDCRPVNGQTLREKVELVHSFLHDMSLRFEGKSGIIVAHRDTNIALQIAIEHIAPSRINAAEHEFYMENATLIQYLNDGRRILRRDINPHHPAVSEWRTVR